MYIQLLSRKSESRWWENLHLQHKYTEKIHNINEMFNWKHSGSQIFCGLRYASGHLITEK